MKNILLAASIMTSLLASPFASAQDGELEAYRVGEFKGYEIINRFLSERLLDDMDSIYTALVTLDFHDAVSGGLRRRLDAVRPVLERTRGDVTTSLRQAKLEQALAQLEEGLRERGSNEEGQRTRDEGRRTNDK